MLPVRRKEQMQPVFMTVSTGKSNDFSSIGFASSEIKRIDTSYF